MILAAGGPKLTGFGNAHVRDSVSLTQTGVTVGSQARPGLGWSSECPDWAYDSPSEGSLPAAVGVEREPGQFPVSVLGVVGQDPPRGVASVSGRAAGQVNDEVGVLGHRSYCA